MPYIIDALMISLMGLITWQATKGIPRCKGREEWLIGSLLIGLGRTIEIVVEEMKLDLIWLVLGFAILSMGLLLNTMALDRILLIRRKAPILLLLAFAGGVMAFDYGLPNHLASAFRALLIAALFIRFIVIFIKLAGRKTFEGLGVYLLLFSISSTLFILRAASDLLLFYEVEISLPSAELREYLIVTIASLSLIASSVAFLSVVLMEYSDSLRYRAERDALTGLFNRRSLEKKIEALQAENGTCAVVMVDIDTFKTINDRFGHEIGDRVLKEFANHLSTSVRVSDFLARYGGEEFCLILDGLDSHAAYRVVDRMRIVFNQKDFVIDGKAYQFSFSAGIASNRSSASERQLLANGDLRADNKLTNQGGWNINNQHGNCLGDDPKSAVLLSTKSDVDSLLQLADRALYRAKKEGRNRVYLAN